MRLLNAVTDQVIYFVAVDATDLKTRKTGLTGHKVFRSRNGSASAEYASAVVTEVSSTHMPGVYKLLINEHMSMTTGNTTEEMVIHITHDGGSMAPVTRVIELFRSEWDELAANHSVANSFGARSSSSSAVQLAHEVWALETDSHADVTAAGSFGEALDDISVPNIADAVWNEDVSEHQDIGSFGQAGQNHIRLPSGMHRVVRTGVCGGAGNSTTIYLDSTASAVADHYNDMKIIIYSGPGVATTTERTITDYVGSSNRCTVTTGTVTNTTSRFIIYENVPFLDSVADAVWNEVRGTYADGTFGNSVDVRVMTVNTDAITAVGIKADAVTKIQDGLSTVTTDQVNTQVDAAIVTYGLDHLVQASVTGTDVADNSIIAKLVSKDATADWDDFVNTTDSLEAIKDNAQPAAAAALVAINLNHLMKEVAEDTDITNQSVIGQMAAISGNWSGFDKADDSLQAIRDRGDTHWITGGSPPSASDIYAHFVSGTNENAFKADVSSLSTLTSGQVLTQATAALVAINLDHLMSASAADTDIINQSVIAQMVATSGNFSGYDKTTDSLQAASENASLIRTTITSRTSQTEFRLTAGSTDDDAYIDALAVITDATTAGQIGFARVSDYVGSTKTVTLSADPGFTHAVDDKVEIRLVGSVATPPTPTEIYTHFTAGTNENAFKASVSGLSTLSASDVLDQAAAALVAVNLDHLMFEAVDDENDMTTEVANETVLCNIMSKTQDTSSYDHGLHSLEAGPAYALKNINLDHLMAVAALDTDIIHGSVIAQIAASGTPANWSGFVNGDDSLQAISENLENGTDGLSALKTLIDAVKTETALIVADTDELQSDDVPGLIGDLNDISATQVNAQVDAAIVTYNLDHLMHTAVGDNSDMTLEVVDGSVLSNIMSATSSTSTYVVADDSLEAIRVEGDDSWTTGAGGSSPTEAEIFSYFTHASQLTAFKGHVAAALADIHLDHLLSLAYDDEGHAESLLRDLTESDGGTFRFTSDALAEAPSGTGASAATIADAVWNEAMGDHKGPTTFGGIQRSLHLYSSTVESAQAGTSDLQYNLVDGEHAINADAYNECIAVFTDQSNTAIVNAARITDYAAGNRRITIDVAPSNVPVAGDYLSIVPALPLSKIGNNVITAASLNTDAVTEIAAGIWNSLTAAYATADTFGKAAADILTDTAQIGAAGIGLTDLGGMSDGMKAEVNVEADSALSDYDPPTQTEMNTAHALLATVEKQDVIDGLVDLVKAQTVDALSEPSSVPGATPTLEEAIMYLYGALRNKLTVTSSAKTFHKDDESALYKKTLTDNGTTYTEGEAASP